MLKSKSTLTSYLGKQARSKDPLLT